MVWGGDDQCERRTGGGGNMCVNEAFCFILLSEKIKRASTLELAPNTWCFFLACCNYYAP
jgi:hypothetical protein